MICACVDRSLHFNNQQEKNLKIVTEKKWIKRGTFPLSSQAKAKAEVMRASASLTTFVQRTQSLTQVQVEKVFNSMNE